ncbi:unnamed protein product [Symbiodinium natans]|uniref:Uncharacterized protein n=1 Tax=Symbiodinium natans TaxID=878477 RepID=A0A812V9T9_9DINO|nr:unnamed protein product [Symbiodinium natans]
MKRAAHQGALRPADAIRATSFRNFATLAIARLHSAAPERSRLHLRGRVTAQRSAEGPPSSAARGKDRGPEEAPSYQFVFEVTTAMPCWTREVSCTYGRHRPHWTFRLWLQRTQATMSGKEDWSAELSELSV